MDYKKLVGLTFLYHNDYYLEVLGVEGDNIKFKDKYGDELIETGKILFSRVAWFDTLNLWYKEGDIKHIWIDGRDADEKDLAFKLKGTRQKITSTDYSINKFYFDSHLGVSIRYIDLDKTINEIVIKDRKTINQRKLEEMQEEVRRLERKLSVLKKDIKYFRKNKCL